MNEFAPPRLVTIATHQNLNSLLGDRVADDPGKTLLERKTPSGGWAPVTAAEFDSLVAATAKGFIARGLQPGQRIAIMSHTRFEWTVLDWAGWAAGLVPVPIYETSSTDQVAWILEDSQVTLAVVETADHAATAAAAATGPLDVLTLDDDALGKLAADGAAVPDTELDRRRTLAARDDLATIIYTSGTTGRPKGVELTHGNFHSLALNAVLAIPEVFGAHARTLLFLPLAHVFARFVEVLAVAGGSVLGHTADPATLMDDLAAFRPTYVLSVPRVFEKVYNGAEQKAAAGRTLRIFQWAAATAIEYSRALDTPTGPRRSLRTQHRLADRLVYGKLRAAMGGSLQYAVSGGAPLGERLGHFFRGAGVQVLEGYGLTETTAPTCVNRPGAQRIGTVGTQLPGCAVRLAQDGEILLRGHHVFRGYHGDPDATASASSDGWFRTGDIGTLDANGYLSITGRKKELIVTAGGKNVAPAVLEDGVRAHPLVSQCVAVGDRRPFIGALITLDREGLPGWLAMHGLPALEAPEAAHHPQVRAAIDAAVGRANQTVSRAESIRKFSILDTDFTVANGYLTPSLKVKRDLVLRDFAGAIDAIYADGPAPVH